MIRLFLLFIAAAPAQAQIGPPTAPPAQWGKANDANLAAMARPADLVAGPARPMGPANGQLEAAAVARLLAGKARDLVRENASQGAGRGAPQ